MSDELVAEIATVFEQCMNSKNEDLKKQFAMKGIERLKVWAEKSGRKKREFILDNLLDYYYYKNLARRGRPENIDRIASLDEMVAEKLDLDTAIEAADLFAKFEMAPKQTQEAIIKEMIPYAKMCAEGKHFNRRYNLLRFLEKEDDDED
ncbi:unnamed protein product [Rotaria sp. Silwood2]|nr:unnamed protein product [Rotaria sp. Silwood2]CAF3473088.1 unnamed protein product [Rotaria sp. Silwood2]CAF4509376.1 unnamed protein product [Rotaria sp. Silwood2]CAF4627663.1 unnamed protein product [Rotaria sp. Silwood2]